MTTWADGTTATRLAGDFDQLLDARENTKIAAVYAGGTAFAKAVINNSSTSAALAITQTGNTSASTSVGGALNINNTANSGAGIVVYSAHASPSGRLIVARADNATFGQTAIFAQQAGTGHAFHADVTQTNSSTSSAGNFTSANAANSAVFISGVETGRGTLKITHTGTGTDANAAGISIDLAGSGTAAQGIFIDATGGGTTGDLLDLRNNSVQLFKVKTNGYVQFGNGGPIVGFGTGSPEGVITGVRGSTWKRTDGGTGTTLYIKEAGTGNTGWVAVTAGGGGTPTSPAAGSRFLLIGA